MPSDAAQPPGGAAPTMTPGWAKPGAREGARDDVTLDESEQVFDPRRSASTTPTSPGRSWSGRCPTAPARAAPAGSPPVPTGVTARRGPTFGPPTCRRRRWSGGSAPRPTPSCTATPPSASSTGPATPRSWPRRRCALGLEALAITDHDGFYGVVRFAEAARAVGMPTVFGAELSLGLTKPQNGMPDPEGSHLLVLARGPEGYAAPGFDHQRRPAARGREGQADLRRHRLGGGPRRPLGGAHRLPEGHRPPGARAPRPGCRGAGARRADRHLRAPQRGGGAVRPRRSARLAPQRRPRPDRDAARVSTWSPPPTPTTHRRHAVRSPPRWPRSRAAQPRRARPMAAGQRWGAPALGRRAGPPLRRAGRARWSGPPSSGARAPSTCSWWRRSSRRSRAPTASARWPTSAASPPRARAIRIGCRRTPARGCAAARRSSTA